MIQLVVIFCHLVQKSFFLIDFEAEIEMNNNLLKKLSRKQKFLEEVNKSGSIDNNNIS